MTSVTVRRSDAAHASLSTGTDGAYRSTTFRNARVCEKLSNALDPSRTAGTAIIPGRTGNVVR